MKRIALTFLFCFVFMAFCHGQGRIYHIRGSNTYVAAILTEKFQPSYITQKENNWCWAACIQMVLHYQGINVSQSTIVANVFGSAQNRPAGCEVITEAANGWKYNGQVIQAFSSQISAYDMIDDLANTYPLIIGLNMPGQNVGHAYVLTAIYFYYANDGSEIPFQVTLRDPWPGNPPTTTISWQDFTSRINCVVHVTY
jgi:ABC-type bacteriocin/lantibiotic exporter with double-glycine peptidase domain